MSKIKFKPGIVTACKLAAGHVALILTPQAAQWLADIQAMIGGNPQTSRRKHSQDIGNELHRIGFRWSDEDVNGRSHHDCDIDPTRARSGFTFLDKEGSST